MGPLTRNATEFWPGDGDRVGKEKWRSERQNGLAGESERETSDRVIKRQYADGQASYSREGLGDSSRPRDDRREKRRVIMK